MLTEFLPFTIEIDPTAIAGTALWSLSLYLGLFPVSEWIALQLTRWFNFAEQSLYPSKEEFERTRKGREAQNSFYASLFSIIPFLLMGWLLGFGIDRSLGRVQLKVAGGDNVLSARNLASFVLSTWISNIFLKGSPTKGHCYF